MEVPLPLTTIICLFLICIAFNILFMGWDEEEAYSIEREREKKLLKKWSEKEEIKNGN